MKYKITDTDALYAEFPNFFSKKEVIILDRRKVTHALKAGFKLPGIQLASESVTSAKKVA